MRLLRDYERLHHLGERFAVSGHNLDLTKLSHDLSSLRRFVATFHDPNQ
jgi:hypothetical protein